MGDTTTAEVKGIVQYFGKSLCAFSCQYILFFSGLTPLIPETGGFNFSIKVVLVRFALAKG